MNYRNTILMVKEALTTNALYSEWQRIYGWYQLRAHVKIINMYDRVIGRRVTGDCRVVVSLTTYSTRILTVHTTIQSIVAGAVRPTRFILWLDGDPEITKITPQLRRLQQRGLEIIYSENYGPHTKYFPYVKQYAADGIPLVTADDDVIYTKEWLADLMEAHNAQPDVIYSNLARRISLDAGKLTPYLTWEYVNSCEPSNRNFALGVGGVIYPACFLLHLREAGEVFMRKCPKQDDIWLHALAVRHGYEISQIKVNPLFPITVPFTQDIALFSTNQMSGGNDAAISATYSLEDLELLAKTDQALSQV